MKVLVFICCLVALSASAQMLSEADPLLAKSYRPLQTERSYVSEVELVDNLETAPNPSLVPHYFIESGKPGKLKKIGKKIKNAIKKGAKKVAKFAKKTTKALGKKMKQLAALAKKGDKKAAAALKKVAKKFKKGLKKLTGADKEKAKAELKKSKEAAAKAEAATKKTAEELKKAKEERAKKRKAAQERLDKRAKRTDRKVRGAMDKLRHLHTNMDGLKRLMKRINTQIQGLLPEKRIRKYGLDEVQKISHSLMTGGLRGDEKKLVNGFESATAQNDKSEAYLGLNKELKGLPVIRKADDLNVQDMSAAAKEQSKFVNKLAQKDTVSLV